MMMMMMTHTIGVKKCNIYLVKNRTGLNTKGTSPVVYKVQLKVWTKMCYKHRNAQYVLCS